jgi:alkaline phosphatase D
MAVVRFSRRRFTTLSGAAAIAGVASPFYSRANQRPAITHGVQSGDVDTASGMVWTRADRPSKIMFEVSTKESFADAEALAPLDALPDSDFATKRLLSELPANQEIFYRMRAVDLGDVNAVSEPVVGRFRTAPVSRRDVRFAWSADTAGQGWGIDETGMATYATIARHSPDFFVHSGDTVYADNPLSDTVTLRDGKSWKNVVVTDAKRKVAETLAEFRGQWRYNLLDRHVRALNAVCPTFFQWDDHDVVNNWSPGLDLRDDARYTEKSVQMLRARAARAFHEMTPIRYTPEEPGRVYRKIGYGPLLDVFFVDLRSYRAANRLSMASNAAGQAEILGRRQLAWLKRALARSRAIWKVIASDMPIGLIVWDDFVNRSGAEAVANGEDGPPRGRELEFAELLRFIRDARIVNTVWLTADVHYTAAHYYDPALARFTEFAPFWEFVSGPLHAGTFGPNQLDATFGPQVRYIRAPTPEQGFNLPPSFGLQFFGLVDIDGANAQMTVRLMDRADNELFRVTLEPAAG